MPKPVLLAVDDEPAVLSAVERDLRARYAKDYRILGADSGEVALETVRQLVGRGEPLALLLVDQGMPRRSGIEFLTAALPLAAGVGKVLLTAYADTDAAIRAINQVGLNHYLMKPWDPPEEKLSPILDDLLDEWRREVRLPFDGIRVVGALWSPDSHTIKDFLARHQIPYLWMDVDHDERARQLAPRSP